MEWLNKLKEYAPHIAAAVVSGGATLPSLAIKAISDATGEIVDSEQGLADFVTSASPEAMLKVKQADNSFRIRMKELDLELDQAELKDQQHAREQHKHSMMPAVITFMMTLIVGGLMYSLFYVEIPEGNADVLYLVTGQALALWAASVTYWVGTTRSSAEKNRKLRAI